MSDEKAPKKPFKTSPSLRLISSKESKAQKALVPPLLHEVGKLAAGVAAVNAGSATGNPRNKCALQPGHSLMDWIRLGSSGKDLAGVGSRAGHLNVTLKELANHDKESDAWLCVRGKVYNITQYLSFHPGGVDEIMKGAGRDATVLFDQVHPWVNFDQILNKCLIGRLVAESDVTAADLFSNNLPSKVKNCTPNSSIKSAKEKIENKDENSIIDQSAVKENVTLPRFDWIQKMDSITIIFYTRAFSNAQLEINPPNQDNQFNIYINYDGRLYANEIKFSRGIQWPCQIKANYETGKIEIVFKKTDSNIWENFGTLKQKTEATNSVDLKLKYSVINKMQINQNTCLLELERVDASKLSIPIGKHVRVFGKIKGEEMSRSYTPVPCSLFTKYKPQLYTTDNVCLMVKSYPNGNISKFICSKNKYDVLELSRPLGTFNLQDIENRELFLLLAGGTGITPMLGLLSFLLDRRVRRCQRATLLFFNRSEEDVLFKNQFDTLQKEDNRFRVDFILSEPNQKWKGLKGRVSSEILQDALRKLTEDTGYTKKDVYVAICGPTPFTNIAHSLLKELEVTEEQLYLFLG